MFYDISGVAAGRNNSKDIKDIRRTNYVKYSRQGGMTMADDIIIESIVKHFALIACQTAIDIVQAESNKADPDPDVLEAMGELAENLADVERYIESGGMAQKESTWAMADTAVALSEILQGILADIKGE